MSSRLSRGLSSCSFLSMVLFVCDLSARKGESPSSLLALLSSTAAPFHRSSADLRRSQTPTSQALSLDQFIDAHDNLFNGPRLDPTTPLEIMAKHPQSDFRRVKALANVEIYNDFPTVDGLHAYLDGLDLLDEERLRPGWDQYFMVRYYYQT